MSRNEDRDLTTRRRTLDLDPETFRAAGHDLVDRIAEFLGTIRARPTNRDDRPADIRAVLPLGPTPETGADPRTLLADTAQLLFDRSLHNGHPRFFGYITSSAAPIGALADLLAGAVNPNLGGWQLSPLASEIEAQAVRWIAEMVGFGGRHGLLVSGGNMANFVCFLAARRRAAGESLRRQGIDPADGRLAVYASAEAHTWLHKAADLFGLGTESLRWVPTDDDQRLDVDALREAIRRDRDAGYRPFLVVGTAGTVSTGVVDPLPAIAEVAHEEGLWFHVDGAYGAFAALAPGHPADLDGIARADSVAVDPHKWLYAPLEAGCALVRDREALTDAFRYTPPYYHFADDDLDPPTNYYELGPQNSRGFRALKVWLAIRQAGRGGYARMIADDIRLTERLFDAVGAHPELEGRSRYLSIATFRYVPPDLRATGEDRESYLDTLNERLLARIKVSGETFLTNAVIGGRFLLRTCIVNFRTTLGDVQALPDIVARHGRAAEEALRESEAGVSSS